MKARHVLVIADACYAGALLLREVQPDPAMSRLYELPSRKAMTSGSKETVPTKAAFWTTSSNGSTQTGRATSPPTNCFRFRTAVMNNSPVQPQFGTIANVGDEGGKFLFPLRQARSAADSLVAEFGDTASNPVVGGDTSRGTLPTMPREIIRLRIREFVDRIAKKDLPSLDEAYRAVPGQPADRKENLLRLVRDDLISASVAGTPKILIEGTEATVDLKVLTQYNDPLSPANRVRCCTSRCTSGSTVVTGHRAPIHSSKSRRSRTPAVPRQPLPNPTLKPAFRTNIVPLPASRPEAAPVSRYLKSPKLSEVSAAPRSNPT